MLQNSFIMQNRNFNIFVCCKAQSLCTIIVHILNIKSNILCSIILEGYQGPNLKHYSSINFEELQDPFTIQLRYT